MSLDYQVSQTNTLNETLNQTGQMLRKQ